MLSSLDLHGHGSTIANHHALPEDVSIDAGVHVVPREEEFN